MFVFLFVSVTMFNWVYLYIYGFVFQFIYKFIIKILIKIFKNFWWFLKQVLCFVFVFVCVRVVFSLYLGTSTYFPVFLFVFRWIIFLLIFWQSYKEFSMISSKCLFLWVCVYVPVCLCECLSSLKYLNSVFVFKIFNRLFSNFANRILSKL